MERSEGTSDNQKLDMFSSQSVKQSEDQVILQLRRLHDLFESIHLNYHA